MNRTLIKYISFLIPVSKWRKAFRNSFNNNLHGREDLYPITNSYEHIQIQNEIVEYHKNPTTLQDFAPKITCALCHHVDSHEKFEVYETNCIFGGGKLIRYKCPKCGVIFGPFKMLNMTEKELSDDYAKHYNIYSEGDSSLGQMEAFLKLNPTKDGIYLNHGCGNSEFAIKAMEIMRLFGYNVYGYDPYAENSSKNDWLITDEKELLKIKFDGIFNYNVIEHLNKPIENLSYLLQLLKPNGKLICSTACYDYKYEYTRFHLFFYTGNSVQYIADKINANYEFVAKEETKYMENAVIFTKK